MKIFKNEIYLNIAGFNIVITIPCKSELNNNILKLNDIAKKYEGFLINRSETRIDFEIQIIDGKTTSKISKNATKTSEIINKKKRENLIKINYQINLFQFQYVLRTVLQTLLKNNTGFFLHASSNNIKGKAYLFLGKNSAGKSTISQLIGGKYPILADDMVIVRKEKGIFKLYQSPYIEKNRNFRRNSGGYIIDKIFFLRKANFCKLEKIESKTIILLKILNQLYTDKNNKKKQLKYIFDLVSITNEFYNLYFTKNEENVKNLFI